VVAHHTFYKESLFDIAFALPIAVAIMFVSEDSQYERSDEQGGKNNT
jgi:hypothetical protein